MSRRLLILGFLLTAALFSGVVVRLAYVTALNQAAERAAADAMQVAATATAASRAAGVEVGEIPTNVQSNYGRS